MHQARELALDRVSLQAGDRHDHACGGGRALEVPTGQTAKETNRKTYASTHARARTERDRGGWARAHTRARERTRTQLLRSVAARAMLRRRLVVPLPRWHIRGLDGWRSQINIDSVLEQLERPRISVLPPNKQTNKQTSIQPHLPPVLSTSCPLHGLAMRLNELLPSGASANSSS